MIDYRDGFKYEQLSDGRWKIEFPTGSRTIAPKQTEIEIKAAIDSFIANMAEV